VSDTPNETEDQPTSEEVSDTSSQPSDAEVSDTSSQPSDAEVSDTSSQPSDATSVDEVSDTTSDAPSVDEVSDTTSDAPSVEEVSDTKKARSGRHVPRSQRRQRSKPVREKPATRKPITRTEKPETAPARRQERRGVVVSDKGDKTIVVKVDVIKSHPKYKKVVRRSVKFHAHDEQNTAGVGDTVRIVETRPLSKQKRWRLAEVVEKAR